jgi:predicted small secreted protein
MMNRVMTVAVVAAVAFVLAGCSAHTTSVQSTGGKKPDSVEYHGPVPTFTGPWAAAFADAYRSTTSRLDHKILATNKITDEDYAAVGSTFISCMATHGYTVKLGSMVDTFQIDSPGLTNAEMKAQGIALNACQTPFDAVGSLYLRILQNPQNQDLNALVVQCLVKDKEAPAGYTETQYTADLRTQTFPFDIDSAQANSCINSPLGLSVSQSSK